MSQILASGLAMGCIYALVGLGFILIYNATGGLNFAQGELVMLAAFVFYSMIGTGAPYAAAALITIFLMGLCRHRLPAADLLPAARSVVPRIHHRDNWIFSSSPAISPCWSGAHTRSRSLRSLRLTSSASETSCSRPNTCSLSPSPSRY